MEYTVQELATIAGITIRTLHHYDELGLLNPARVAENGYRYYCEPELLKLQQIMFFREMEIPLARIKEILESRSFDLIKMLQAHKKALSAGISRHQKLLKTIDNTILKLKKGEPMSDVNLYTGFTKEEAESYAQEAKERWGHTAAYKESQIKVKKMGAEGLKKIMLEGKRIEQELAKVMDQPVNNPHVQELIKRHRAQIGSFYEVSDEIYHGLAHMYVDDPRFAAHYDQVKSGLSQFLSKAMLSSLKK